MKAETLREPLRKIFSRPRLDLVPDIGYVTLIRNSRRGEYEGKEDIFFSRVVYQSLCSAATISAIYSLLH